MRIGAGNDEGSALVGAMLVVFLLSLLAIAVLKLSVSSRAVVEAQAQAGRDQAIAEAATEVFLQQTLLPHTGNPVQSGTVEVFGESIDIVAKYERGKINLNRANFDLLSALFAAAGQDENTAEQLAAAVMDWRDRNDERGEIGAEIDDYVAADKSHGPRNGFFETVGELRYVLGMDDQLYGCVAPLLTVTSDQEEADLDLAGPGVLAVYAWAEQKVWNGADWSGYQGEKNVAGQAVTLEAALPNAPGGLKRVYASKIRIKSTGDKSFERLSRLEKTFSDAGQPSCEIG